MVLSLRKEAGLTHCRHSKLRKVLCTRKPASHIAGRAHPSLICETSSFSVYRACKGQARVCTPIPGSFPIAHIADLIFETQSYAYSEGMV